MTKIELDEREVSFLEGLLDNVPGLNVLEPETRAGIREMILSIKGKIKKQK